MIKAIRHRAGDREVQSIERAQQFWSDHQMQIQKSLGRPAFALRLAPPGSARYRLARRILGSTNVTTTSTWPLRLTATRTSERAPQLGGALLCSLGDSTSSIDGLNELVASANPATWIFAVSERDASAAPHGVDELVRTAPEQADVVYGDEVAPGYENLTPSAPGIHSTLSYGQLGRSVIVRREAWLKVGGLNRELGSAALADLLLRLVESGATFTRSNAVVSWSHPPSPLELGALEQALVRRGITATVTRDGAHRAQWRVALPTTLPTVDILIPTRDRLDLLRQCIDSVRSNTTYQNYRIVVLDNDSVEPATRAYLDSGDVAVTPCPGPFNYASVINRGVAASAAEVVIETLGADVSERGATRMDDKTSEASMEKRKKDGYF